MTGRLRGGGKRGRSGVDGTKNDKMQRISDVKEEYQTLAVLIDPLIQNNVQLQSIVKNTNTLLASVSDNPDGGLKYILRRLTVPDLQAISEGLTGTNGDVKVEHIARVLFGQDIALVTNQEKACKSVRLLVSQANKIAVFSGFMNETGNVDFKNISKVVMDIIIEKSRSSGSEDMQVEKKAIVFGVSSGASIDSRRNREMLGSTVDSH